LHAILESIEPQLRSNLIIKKNDQHENLLQRTLAHPRTLDLFLSFIPKQDILQHLFQSESTYCFNLVNYSQLKQRAFNTKQLN
jgi:hypothetical protein